MRQGVLNRYRDFLPITPATPMLTLGEGGTPLVRSVVLEKELGCGELYFKLEGCNPTGSFKDRGMVMAIAKAVEDGSSSVICASTGNTSASAAAYGARFGLDVVVIVPKGKIALFTVCNLAIDGVFLNLGIPILFKYGGPVQFVDNQPVRFVDLISYEGTTIPPLEVFVYRNATSILSVLRTGSGLMPANLREIPVAAEEKAEKILADLRKKEWHGILKFGKPNESILGVPVAMDRIGISMIGGLTPAAALREIGAKIDTFAPHCLIPVEEMDRI